MRCKSEPVKGQAMRCVVASPSFRYFYVSGEHDMLCFEDNAKLIEQSPNKIQCIAIDQEGKTVVGASIKDLLGFQQ